MVLTGMMFGYQIVTTIVMLFLSALLLLVSAKIFKLKDQTYKTALKVTLIIFVINFILGLIGLALLSVAVVMAVLSFLVLILGGLYLIRKYYNLDWGKAALTWIVWFILTLIAGFIISMIMGAIFIRSLLTAAM